MPTNRTGEILRRLRGCLLARDGAGLPDAELFALYARDRDEGAFAALVRRHGPMVWGVCRRLLAHHDAEDAFQAAFLVLANKAASGSPPDHLAGWLHGVAYHVARKAAARAARHRRRQRQVREMPEPTTFGPGDYGDLWAVFDEELSQLPDIYRQTVVLCDLEGRTHREAAVAMRCPEGTVAGRLSRARAALAVRLSRRGLILSAGALAALSAGAVRAGVPAAVASTALNVVALMAAGEQVAGLLPASACELVNGGLQAMWLTKFKVVVAAVLLASAAGVFYGTPGGEGAPRADVAWGIVGAARAADDAKTDDKVRKDEESQKKALEELRRQAEAEEKELRRLILKSEATLRSVGEMKKALDKLEKETDRKTAREAIGEIEKELAKLKRRLDGKPEGPEQSAPVPRPKP